MIKISLLLQSLVLLCTAINGQPLSEEVPQRIKSIGLPFMTTYGPSDYDFSSHNFDVFIGGDQKIYFANHQGVLVFDGINWTRLRLPKETPAYSFAKSEDGTIYVGAMNEIGYLSANESGSLAYISLIDRLPEDKLGTFTARLQTVGTKIIGSILGKTLLIDPKTKEVTILNNPKDATSIQSVNGKLYAFSNDKLYQFQNDRWEFERESHIMEDTKIGIGHLVQIRENKVLAITQNGFFDFETDKKIEINKDVENILSQSMVYRVSILSEKYIAICTWSGLLITDHEGNPVQFIDKEKGLPDNYLFRVALDKQGILWVAMYNGIAKIDLFSAYSILDKRMNVEGVIKDVQMHKGNLYYSAIPGVFRENWQDIQYPFFKPEFGQVNNSVCHQMINTGEDLFVYTERQNNLVLEDGRFEEIIGTQDKIYWAGFKYKESDDLLLASHDGFLMHIIKKEGKWIVRKQLDPLFQSVYFLFEGEGDAIWLSDVGEGIFKMTYDVENAELLNDKNYGATNGLPSDKNNFVYEIGSKPCFTTEKGIYRYDEPSDSFVPDERFVEVVGEEAISMISEDEHGNLYYFSDEFVMLRNADDGFKKVRFPNMDFKKYPPSDLTVIDHENIFISSLNAIVHVNPAMIAPANDFEVKFSRLFSSNTDSVIFSGFGGLPDDLFFLSKVNALRFSFSAAFYQNPERTQYIWRLKGFDEGWSDWSFETQKDYTNLPHGDYTFEVIAMNVHGVESSPATIRFSIETPWYFTWWAYLIYAIITTLFIWVIVKLNTHRLIQEKRKLEGIVTERTKEISQQKEIAEKDAQTISSQHKELQEMDELKGRFFLNISHELRTPLTLAMGTVDQALRGKYGALNNELYANLKSSFRNNKRLLKMVNNILDISKLESGDMNLQVSKTKPSEILSRVTDFFSSKFLNKKVELRCNFKSATELFLDKDKFETIFINLIANAFKFTSDGGFVSISISEKKDVLEISVEDNGIGIPKEEICFVFDRFYQSSHGPSDGGTGLGLALTKELIELHKGNISVESNVNLGTKLTVTFLKGKGHFEESQIIEEVKSEGYKNMEDKNPLSDLPQEVAQNKEKNETQLIDKQKPHILLVEDNLEMSRFVAEILSNNYQVTIVNNGQEGLEFLEDTTPDLILTDYLMPIMNGYEMASEIKKSEKLAFIPMIFLTARTGEQDKIDVLNLGVDDYLFKPFNSDELQVRINNLLNTKNQRLEFISSKAIDPRDIEWKEFPSKLKLDIDEYIKTYIKEDISGDDLANFTKQSERSLYRKIKVNTGLSLMQYIKEYRLRQARIMLENREAQTVSEVAYEVGFNYLSHFTKNYKERFGKQPSEYLE